MEWLAPVTALFGKGIDAYTDLEKSKNFSANGTTLGTRDQYGNYVAAGQSANYGSFGMSNQTLLIIGALAAVGLLIALRK